MTGNTYRRLRVGAYRVMYAVEDDLVTVIRIDRMS
jgi:mRNA-degrading endonuclease RelE of RelBE toxin-antitoxin system